MEWLWTCCSCLRGFPVTEGAAEVNNINIDTLLTAPDMLFSSYMQNIHLPQPAKEPNMMFAGSFSLDVGFK